MRLIHNRCKFIGKQIIKMQVSYQVNDIIFYSCSCHVTDRLVTKLTK